MPPDYGNRGEGGDGTVSRAGEIYFDFYPVWKTLKVTTIDANTGIEVVVMESRSAPQSDLEQIAFCKLKARIEREHQ